MFLVDKMQYLVFNTPKLEAMQDYYERILGLPLIEESPQNEVWLGQNSNNPTIILRKSVEASLGEVGMTVRNKEAFDKVIENLERKALAYETYISPNLGETVAFDDSDGHAIRLHLLPYVSGPNLKNAASIGPKLGRLQHTTYASVAPYQLAEFYEEVLEFKISDEVDGQGFVWLRTDEDHHTIAAASNVSNGLDHYAFELPDWASFKEWCDYLGEQDVEVVWGPGRHGPGNNLFIFTIDPDGNRIEYSAEMEKFHDRFVSYSKRVWKNQRQTLNLWGPGAPWKRQLPTEVEKEATNQLT